MKVLLASRNAGKLREFAELLPGLELVAWPEGAPGIPETGAFFQDNALHFQAGIIETGTQPPELFHQAPAGQHLAIRKPAPIEHGGFADAPRTAQGHGTAGEQGHPRCVLGELKRLWNQFADDGYVFQRGAAERVQRPLLVAHRPAGGSLNFLQRLHHRRKHAGQHPQILSVERRDRRVAQLSGESRLFLPGRSQAALELELRGGRG